MHSLYHFIAYIAKSQTKFYLTLNTKLKYLSIKYSAVNYTVKSVNWIKYTVI